MSIPPDSYGFVLLLGAVVNQAREAPPATTAKLPTPSPLARSFKRTCNSMDPCRRLGRFKSNSRAMAESRRTLSLGRIHLKVFCLREELSRMPAICPTLEMSSSSRKLIKEVEASVNRTNKVVTRTAMVFFYLTRIQWIERRLTLRKSELQPGHTTNESLQTLPLTT